MICKKTVTYDKKDLETLLDYNIKLFTSAAEVIRSGNFAVNPYTEDGKVCSKGIKSSLLLILRPTATWDRRENSCVYQVRGKKEAYLELMAKDEDDNEMQVAEKIVPFQSLIKL